MILSSEYNKSTTKTAVAKTNICHITEIKTAFMIAAKYVDYMN